VIPALSVRAAAAEHPRRVALVLPERSWTWAELAAEVAPRADELARAFAARGRPLVFVGSRAREAMLDLYAALDAGVPVYLLHPRWTELERARARERSGARDADLRGAGLAAFVHTSGSTGTPKALALSARALEASAAASAANLGWREGDRWLLAMTPAHVGGLSIVTRCLAARRTVVVAAPGRFAASALLDVVEAWAVTLLSVVPTMLARLLGHLADRGRGFPPTLRAMLVGGAAVPAGLLERARGAGVEALATYGLTEACSQVATQRIGERGPGAPPLPGVVVAIRGGRVHVGGPTLYSGTLRDGALVAPVLADGLYDTGDLGRLAGGRLFVAGRADDRIVTGGENVDPSEVEDALGSLPGVDSAVVFGVPDAEWGEAVSAAIVPSTPDVDAAGLAEALRERVADFRLPRRWHVVDALPTTASGKIDRRAVIEALREDGRPPGHKA